jgi:Sec-independent protein translocase protein TatA
MGVEIVIVLVVALIVIPPDKLPEAVRTVAEVFHEIKSASDKALREVGEMMNEIPHSGTRTGTESSAAREPEVVDIAELLTSSKSLPDS